MTSKASSSRLRSDPRNPLATCAPTAVRTAAIATRAPSAGRRSRAGSVPVRTAVGVHVASGFRGSLRNRLDEAFEVIDSR